MAHACCDDEGQLLDQFQSILLTGEVLLKQLAAGEPIQTISLPVCQYQLQRSKDARLTCHPKHIALQLPAALVLVSERHHGTYYHYSIVPEEEEDAKVESESS
jgi:hypothetical protein